MSLTVTSVPILLMSELVPNVLGAVKYTEYAKYSTEKFLNHEMETVIKDKDTLLKTLLEYGATNVVDENDDIHCDCENLYLHFYRKLEEPYKLVISCKGSCGVEEFVNNLSSSYTTNAQEVSYNKIRERLEEQNLQIDEEEIYEDNTIVLTINLE